MLSCAPETEILATGTILRHQISDTCKGRRWNCSFLKILVSGKKTNLKSFSAFAKQRESCSLRRDFDETTTREIAVRAGVGIGTVFTYAENKRDLLFLVANDDLDEVTRKAEASVSEDASCLENLLTVFRQHYKFFAKQPSLSRFLLREMTFYDSGRQAN